MPQPTPRYVDGFVLPIAKKNLAKYKKIAAGCSKIWLEYGALEYFECSGEDLECGSFGTPFPKMTGAKKGETVVFSWISYPSKAVRDKVNAKVMKDPRVLAMCNPKKMPFEVRRMAMGGFQPMVVARAKKR